MTRIRRTPSKARFVVCVKSAGYEASLERNKIYPLVPDAVAARDGDIRVVDESGEDYLYPAEYFVPIQLSPAVRSAMAASR